MCAPPAASASVPEQCLAEPPAPASPSIDGGQCCFGRDSCGQGNISYIQPPRAVSFKPVNTYCKPTEPMESETIYRKSYYPIDTCAMQQARLGPFRRSDNIERSTGKLEDKTVMALSYMGHCGVKPPAPIIPMSRSMLGQGMMLTETTHKHDFVPKPTMRVAPILPHDSMLKTCGPLEKNTTFRLSYMPIDLCSNPPPKAIRPHDEYEKPSLPAEKDTVYKLSYQPVCPPAKEDYPWARKTSHSNPCAPIEKDTIYKLSYLGNCSTQKAEPQYPISCLKLFDGAPSNCTVYRASYMPSTAERPDAIRPEPNIQRADAPVEKDTVYKLSYMGHCGASPPSPIIPAPSRLRSDGPMATETTHKHDYVPKPSCKQSPFLPVNNMIVSRDGLEKDTVYKMSYMPHCNAERAQPIRPISQTCKSDAPMEHDTTFSLSYMPVCPPKREPTPWATRGSYQPPTAPVECTTIQKMSYQPPGMFMDGSGSKYPRRATRISFNRANHTISLSRLCMP